MNFPAYLNGLRLRPSAALLLQVSLGLGLGAIAPQLSPELSPETSQRPDLNAPNAQTSGLASRLHLTGAAPAAAAEKDTEKDRIRWTPPKEQGKAKGTLSGGRRGQESSSCGPEADATQLDLLVPQGQAGLVTTSEHPTFSWQLRTQQPTTMEFILSDMGNPTPIYQQTLDASATQFTSVTLPATVALQPESRYRWTVIVNCPAGQKTEIYGRSFIRQVSGESLEQQLAQKSSVAQASVFAENGVWYDALGRLLQAESAASEDSREALADLLAQALPREIRIELKARQ